MIFLFGVGGSGGGLVGPAAMVAGQWGPLVGGVPGSCPAVGGGRLLPMVAGWLALGLLLAGAGYWLGWHRGRRSRPRQPTPASQIRSSIAANLHDELGSLLLRIALQAEALRTQAPGPATERLLADTQAAGAALRDVAWGLDAGADTLGALQDRMRDLLDQVALTPTPLTIRFDARGLNAATPLPAQLRQEVYLLFKEATTNVLQHAQRATLLAVRLYRRRNNLMLEVLDNGLAARPGARSGMGLRNMRQRAQVLGGKLEIGPRPDGPGFRVCLCAPLAPARPLAERLWRWLR